MCQPLWLFKSLYFREHLSSVLRFRLIKNVKIAGGGWGGFTLLQKCGSKESKTEILSFISA